MQIDNIFYLNYYKMTFLGNLQDTLFLVHWMI